MKTEKIVWGLVLVFLGSILLLQNLDIIDFYWQVIFRFWPVVLILIGANLLFSRDDSRFGALISVFLTIIVLGFITYKGVTTDSSQDYTWSFGEDRKERQSKTSTDVFSEEFNDSISFAVLNISGGATQYTLNDTSASLIEAEVKKNFGKYSLYRTTKDSSEVLNLKMNGKSKLDLKDSGANKVSLRLNPNPIWDINLEMGAGTAKFDLTDFKIRKLAIEGGAASFKIKLGSPQENTTVSVETGVSEIDISIPKGSSCVINTESGLSSNDFKGFIKQSDGSYLSENYNAGNKKFVINLEGGLSNFKVKQY